MPDPATKKRLIAQRLPELQGLLDPCRLCPRNCLVVRTRGEAGECGILDKVVVSSIGLHRGNEFLISGYNGSGNIFAAGCNLHCVYCQNWDVSQDRNGRAMEAAELARHMLLLQDHGAHNINCVTPTHVVPMLLEAFMIACGDGLHLPLVYNTSGYDALATLQLLDGIVDVYLPDMKYGNAEIALRYSDVEDYPRHNQAAVLEMYRQVGPLQRDEHGVAARGVLVRHLVLPNGLGSSEKILNFLDETVPGPVDVNIMQQYRPCWQAARYPELNQHITDVEFDAVVALARGKNTLRLVE